MKILNIFYFKIWSNIFLFLNKQKNRISFKIGDLGNSKIIKGFLQTEAGTPYYQSPELMANQAYNEKADVW